MRYVTTVLTEFDEQLFEKLYADSNQTTLPHCFANIYASIEDEDTRKELLKSTWQSTTYQTPPYLLIPKLGIFVSDIIFKVSDLAIDEDVAYIIAKQYESDTKVRILIAHAMYKSADATSPSAANYWDEYYNKLFTHNQWNIYIPSVEDYPVLDRTTVADKQVLVYVPTWAMQQENSIGVDV